MTGQGRHRPQSWRLCSSKRAMFVVSRLSAGMQGARRKSVLQQRDRRSVCRFTRAYTVFLFLMEARRARKRPGWSRGRGGACLCAFGRQAAAVGHAGRASAERREQHAGAAAGHRRPRACRDDRGLRAGAGAALYSSPRFVRDARGARLVEHQFSSKCLRVVGPARFCWIPRGRVAGSR